MDRPVQSLVVITLVAVSPALCAAEDSTPQGQRLVSPHVAQMLAEVAARQTAASPAPVFTPASESSARPRVQVEERDVSANGIVRLPPYLVRERNLPSREEVMSRRAIEQMAMEKYYGEETSLYRVMNLFSPVYLWRKIPGLGKFPFMIGQFNGPGSGPARGEYTTEDRARARYEFDRMNERWTDLMGLLSPADRARALNPETPPSPPRPAPLK